MPDIQPDLVRELVATAVRAPSSHNTQPWRFQHHDGEVALYADRSRALPVNDPDDRELTISCGAALFNLEVAARARGYRPRTTALPGPDPDLLARVRLEPASDAAAEQDLVAGMLRRHTTRGAFTAGLLPDHLRHHLADVTRQHGIGWHPLEGADRALLADLVDEGDRVQFADPDWRRELAGWMRPRGQGEGLPTSPLTGAASRAVVSRFNLAGPTARKDRARVLRAPLVAVLTSQGDTTGDWLETGRALQHVLLTAAAAGVQAGFLNQPCQVPRLRQRLRDLLGAGGHPQLVLRLGPVAVPHRPPARRPVARVLLRRGARSGNA